MVLHHTGSEDELVYCSTPCLSVTIKGAEASPTLVKCDQKEASLKIVCDDDYEVTLSGDAEMAFSQYLGKAYSAEIRTAPIFFEQNRYELIIEPAEGHTVEFWHENYHVRNKVSKVGRTGKLLSGVINFGNDIGFSDLVFLVDGHQYLKMTIEVFPSKISYKEDYLAIVADVTKEVYNLVFDFLRKTYEPFDISSSRQSSPVEFFAIVQKIYDVNVKQFFTSLGKQNFAWCGKQFFAQLGNEFFAGVGKQFLHLMVSSILHGRSLRAGMAEPSLVGNL